MDIGKRVKQLRTKKNLTLTELASRCELTKGYLSQLENNTASPSVATLTDIVEVLGTNLADFFKEPSEEQYTFGTGDFFEDEKEDSKTTWIVPNAQKNRMEPIILELKPQGKSEEVIPHDGEEFGYVLSGRITLVLGEEKKNIKKGETFYFKGDRTHYLVNDSQHPAKVLWICTPPVF
jgi:transcriptional regulator with XRE-family HTH domain